jgi:hypothetical protein
MKKSLLFLVAMVCSMVSVAKAQIPLPQQFVYSVKFLCGIQPNGVSAPPLEPSVKPGNYATAINIHNFHQKLDVSFCKKAVVALPEDQPPATPGRFVNLLLGPDRAVEVDCSDIAKLLQSGAVLPPFIKGFVEVRSPQQLNVVAVYTAQICHSPGSVGSCQDSLGELSLEVVPQGFLTDAGSCPTPIP